MVWVSVDGLLLKHSSIVKAKTSVVFSFLTSLKQKQVLFSPFLHYWSKNMHALCFYFDITPNACVTHAIYTLRPLFSKKPTSTILKLQSQQWSLNNVWTRMSVRWTSRIEDGCVDGRQRQFAPSQEKNHNTEQNCKKRRKYSATAISTSIDTTSLVTKCNTFSVPRKASSVKIDTFFLNNLV